MVIAALKKEEHYIELSEELQEKCIEEAIAETKFDQTRADIIVNRYLFNHRYDEEEKYKDDITGEDIDKIISRCFDDFKEAIHKKQLKELKEVMDSLRQKTAKEKKCKRSFMQNVRYTTIEKK